MENEFRIKMQHRPEKRFVIATETVDDIVKGRKYELIESEDMDHYIIDESGEVTRYYCKSLRDIEDTDQAHL